MPSGCSSSLPEAMGQEDVQGYLQERLWPVYYIS